MSIWGKIAGAGVGLAVGGPLGALIGAVAGHLVVDRALQDNEFIFTMALIALSAKMAKADGEVTMEEVEAFERVMRIPPAEARNVQRVYTIAQQDVAGYEIYAKQVARIYRDRPAILEDVLDALFYIAAADGKVTPKEITYLETVADIFGFTELEFSRLKASHLGPDKECPYLILGVTPEITDQDLRKAYLRLVRENHPDQMLSRGVPKELVDIANAKLSAINVAYDRIRLERGLVQDLATAP